MIDTLRTMLLFGVLILLVFGGYIEGRTYNVAWLAPQAASQGIQASSSVGGLALGLDTIHKDPHLLPGDNFTYVFTLNHSVISKLDHLFYFILYSLIKLKPKIDSLPFLST